MDFEKFLQTEAKKIKKAEQKHLQVWFDWITKKVPSLRPHARAFIQACSGGKKIRGALVKLGYEISQVHLPGVKAHLEGEIYKISAAYEIFHSSILVHDDIIDQSLDRRGMPSLYQALRPKDGRVGGNHYGVSQAICLADAGFFMAIKIISETNFPDKEKNEALALFSKTMLDTALGQMLDIELIQSDHTSEEKLSVGTKPTSEVIKLINLYKTARYTISGPLQIGAILAGVLHLGGVKAHLRGEQLLGNLAEFGENLGIAFQIRDDILDGEVEVLEESKLEALKYKNIAKETIPDITKDAKMSKLLEQMAEYLVERQK